LRIAWCAARGDRPVVLQLLDDLKQAVGAAHP
jgi:hypothetical protein